MDIKFFIISGSSIVAAAVVLSSESNREGIGTAWRRIINDPGQACFDYQLPRLKDPITAHFSSYFEDPDQASTVVVRYLARNSFGAYVRGEARCVVRGGKVDVAMTERFERINATTSKIDQDIERLRRQNACIVQQTSDLVRGKPASKIDCESLR